MDVPSELVEQFVMLTSSEPSVASQLLADNGMDMEAAVSSYFAIQEASGASTEQAPSTAPQPTPAPASEAGTAWVPGDERSGAEMAAAAALAADEALARQLAAEAEAPEEVRAPIPQRIDQILPEGRRTTRTPQVVRDPFLESDGTPQGDHLTALFRPPTDINFTDNMDAAMTNGQNQMKWLLVNIQKSGDFPCLVLNRDVWADAAVRELISARFIFWQRDVATEHGSRYKQFYPFEAAPHVAIIDPRSGERMAVWGGDGEAIDKDTLMSDLIDFCDRHSLEDDGDAPHRAATRRPAVSTRPERASSSSAPVDLERDVRETEDAQIAAAIAASMEGTAGEHLAETGTHDAADGDAIDVDMTHDIDRADRRASRLLSATNPELNHQRSLRAQQDSEFEESLALDRAKAESEKAEADRVQRVEDRLEQKKASIPPEPPADTAEPISELMIRLPSGKRLQRRFLASNTLADVYNFVDVEAAGEVTEDTYTLLMAFPRAVFDDKTSTLADADLRGKRALVIDQR